MLSTIPDPPVSEDSILTCIDRHFPNTNSALLLGRGDDCAVFKSGMQLCASSDLFIEDIHFRRSYFEPEDMGHKALAVNISDIAAMGARPVAFTLALGLPAWADMPWLERFFTSMAALANSERLILAGGDISRSDKLHIAITAFGECLPDRALLLRGANMPGDILFVIGNLGLAAAGLFRLEADGRKALADWPKACAAHLRPIPQTGAGLMLGRAAYNSRAPALMDVSDGLARDLPRLLGHTVSSCGLGAELEIAPDILHPEVLRNAHMRGVDPVLEAFRGGEDYALLGTCAPDMAPVLHAAIPGFCQIGRITGPGRIYCNGIDVTEMKGFDHFAQPGK